MTDDAARGALSSDQSAELRQWCGLLAGLGDAWSVTAAQLHRMPAPDCQARREDTALIVAHPGWDRNEAFHAGLDAVGLIDAAAQYVGGLRSLITGHSLTLAPWALVRAVVEHISQAGWLLDPDITPEQRVARRWMLKLADAHRYRWYASAVGAANADIRAIKRDREAIRTELTRRFPGADLNWSLEQDPHGPPWVVAEQRHPGLGQMVRRFVDYAGFREVPGLYDLLSLFAHPNLHSAIASSLRRVEREGFVQYYYRVDVEQTIRVMRLAGAFLYRAGMVVSSFFRLDDSELEAWSDPFLSGGNDGTAKGHDAGPAPTP